MVDVILGLQWGDEGKGKIVDYLSSEYQLVARFQGGPNAGHTLVIDGVKHVLHTVPSGIFREGLMNLIGNGVVIDPITLRREIETIDKTGMPFRDRLLIANKAHLILPTHRLLDAASEASKGVEKIGSTLRGIGPTYMDKTGRNGLRAGDLFSPNLRDLYNKLKEKHLELYNNIYGQIDFDLDAEEKKWFEAVDFIKALKFVDGEYYVNDFIKQGKKVLAEGAQGSMLDVDFGTYPFVTSSNTITAGVCSGLGVAPRHIGEVIGVTKAYCTRVGSGPFPTELNDEVGEELRRAGHEFGATTGRPRRCGWIDIPQLKYTIMLNGVTSLVMTKIDVLDEFESLHAAVRYNINGTETENLPFDLISAPIKPVYQSYPGWKTNLTGVRRPEDFPANADAYIREIESLIGTPIKFVSVGPGREQLIIR